jgi:hypothetical protein
MQPVDTRLLHESQLLDPLTTTCKTTARTAKRMSADTPHLVHCPAAGIAARPTSRKLADASCASSYGQCGGTSCQASGCPSSSDSAWTCCPSAFSCQRQSQYYWQCLTGNSSAPSSSPAPSSPKQSSPSAMSPPAQPSSSPSAAAGTTSPQGNAANRSTLAPAIASLICQVMCIPLVMSMFVRTLYSEVYSNA